MIVMVSYRTWVQIAFDLASDDVAATRIMERAGTTWQANKSRLQAASMSEAQQIGRQVL